MNIVNYFTFLIRKMERICSCKFFFFFFQTKRFFVCFVTHDILITIFYVYVTLDCSDSTSIMVQDFFKNIFRV